MAFLLRPCPIPGESLSSWRQRSGQANGFLWFPTGSIPSTGDPDRLPEARETAWLMHEFLETEASLSTLCLNQFSCTSVGKAVGGQFIRWVINHGRAGKNNEAGNGFCPVCLATDPIPHFRLSWRLAFVTHCPIHHCRLMGTCPTCLRKCWPETYANRHKFCSRWTDFRHCPECETDLGAISPVFDNKHQASALLWKRLNNDSALKVTEVEIPRDDYFRALWSTCRLLSRQLNRFASAPALEYLQAILPLHKKGLTIEKQSGEVRQILVSCAIWLLNDWPDRFVRTCNEANISRGSFGAPDNCSPFWFEVVVREHLARSVNWITREDVKAAIGYLDSQGQQVSKNALRRQLGITESRAINELLDQRRAATLQELVSLIRHYQTLISHIPPSRDQQRTLCRDFLILLYSAVSGENAETVCRMTKANIDQLLASITHWSKLDGEIGFIGSTLLEMDDQYRHGVRPVFQVRCSTTIDSWFLSRFGNHMDGHSVRERFAKVMKNLFDPKLWNSMDVFLTSLSGPVGTEWLPLSTSLPPS